MKRMPRWFKIVMMLSLTALVIVLAVPYVLNVDSYRGAIIAAIESSTGRHATIGKIRARLFPTIGFTIYNVSIASPESMGDHPFVAVEQIRGTLAWGPLFHRKLQVSGITLIHLAVQLLEGDLGANNYTFPSAATGAAGASSSFQMADIDAITVTDGQFSLGRVTGSAHTVVPTVKVSHVSVSLTHVALDAARIMNSSVSMNLKGVVIEGPGLAPIEFASGSVTLANGGLRAELEAALGQAAKVAGSFQLEKLDTGVIRFALNTALVDLDQMGTIAAPPTPAGPASLPRATATAAPTTAVATSLLAEGRISADRVKFAPFEGTALKADVRIFTDHVEIAPVTADVYDGTLGIAALVNNAVVPATVTANIEVHRASIKKLLLAVTGDDSVTGTAEIKGQLTAALAGDVVQSLTGHGSATVSNGRIPGFSAGGIMGALAKLESAITMGAGDELAKEIPYRVLSGDIAIAARRISSQKIHFDMVPGTIDLHGSVGFDQRLNYEGRASLSARAQGTRSGVLGVVRSVAGSAVSNTFGRIPIPFSLRGTFGKPEVGYLLGK